MIRYVLFASLVLSACSLSGSPKAQAPAKELNLYLQTDSSSLDPRIGCDCQSVLLIRELFEGLVRIGGNGDPELALASSYTLSDDGTVYTFHLRPATWSNDTPVTANDFVFAPWCRLRGWMEEGVVVRFVCGYRAKDYHRKDHLWFAHPMTSIRVHIFHK